MKIIGSSCSIIVLIFLFLSFPSIHSAQNSSCSSTTVTGIPIFYRIFNKSSQFGCLPTPRIGGGIGGIGRNILQDILDSNGRPLFNELQRDDGNRHCLPTKKSFNWFSSTPDVQYINITEGQFQSINFYPGHSFDVSRGYVYFTAELHLCFVYKDDGDESLTITTDSDLWLYLNRRLLVDLGGIHSTTSITTTLDGLGLKVGKIYRLDIFFAQRYKLGTNITFKFNLCTGCCCGGKRGNNNPSIPQIIPNLIGGGGGGGGGGGDDANDIETTQITANCETIDNNSRPTPTKSPTKAPTKSPTVAPTKQPTSTPTTASPTQQPTFSPTSPTKQPTLAPTSPTKQPTSSPTLPTSPPTVPTKQPTPSPTGSPTNQPTLAPTLQPTPSPTSTPTNQPTSSPTIPTNQPTSSPTSPTNQPTSSPTSPTSQPTSSPTIITGQPTSTPTNQPTSTPTTPTNQPTPIIIVPTFAPTLITLPPSITIVPTLTPTQITLPPSITLIPTLTPTPITLPPSIITTQPTTTPTNAPTNPTNSPTKAPTAAPTKTPTSAPTKAPTAPSYCCGNGILEPGEQCDNGLANNDIYGNCTHHCRFPICGDGIIHRCNSSSNCSSCEACDNAEECDDGNNINGDGCDANCRFECNPLMNSVAITTVEYRTTNLINHLPDCPFLSCVTPPKKDLEDHIHDMDFTLLYWIKNYCYCSNV